MTDISNTQPDSRETTIMDAPDKMVSVRDLFGLDLDMEVPAFSEADERVPDLDPAYVFDADTTLAVLAGFASSDDATVRANQDALASSSSARNASNRSTGLLDVVQSLFNDSRASAMASCAWVAGWSLGICGSCGRPAVTVVP